MARLISWRWRSWIRTASLSQESRSAPHQLRLKGAVRKIREVQHGSFERI
jgi:hypothetical protein